MPPRSFGPPTPTEDPSKWHQKGVPQDAVCRRYGCSPEELYDWIQRYGFPKPTKDATRMFVGSFRTSRHREWALDQIEAWETTVIGIAKRFPRR
ncbi:MAG TPA: helix-turn-helix domain-containing protein [Vicinamibacterales bacterium]|jgi:hypothetical protein|nr:helix-turn-helix domain-containing protein [Vicinamibacterales bacterium]